MSPGDQVECTDNVQVVDYEDLLDRIARQGLYQWVLCVLLSVVGMKAAFDYFALTIVTTEPDWWHCGELYLKSNHNEDIQFLYSPNISMPDASINWTDPLWLCRAPVLMQNSDQVMTLSNYTRPCTRWYYHMEPGENNLVSEWDLVCDQRTLQSLMRTIFMGGILVGTCLGQLADKFGRKPALLTCATVELISNIGLIFASNMTSYMIFRFLSGLSSPIGVICIVILTEQVAKKSRSMFGNLIWINWCAGYIIVAGLGYWLKWWRHLQVAITIPCLLYLIFPFLVTESPRWLYLHGKQQQCREILKYIAKTNGVLLSDNIKVVVNQHDNPKSESSCWSTFLYPKLRLRTLVLYVANLVGAFIYFAISLQSGYIIRDNVFLNTLIAGIIEIPAYFAAWFLMEKYGRRLTFAALLFASAVVLFPVPFLPVTPELLWLRTMFAVVGRFIVTIEVTVLFVYNAELFPTSCRSIGVFQCILACRIGGFLAPPITQLIPQSISWLPDVLYGVSSAITGLLSLLLPETTNKPLPQTLLDAEMFGRKKEREDDADEEIPMRYYERT